MSHQLRTPLNSILGFSAMLCSDPQATKEQRERLEIINRSGEDLLTLINDILEITKIEAGHQELDIAPFDPGALVREVADMMRLRAKEIGLWLNVDQSSAVPRYLRGDGGRLREILMNLVDNAVKFTKTGGIFIRLDLRRNGRPHLVMEVEDSGPGIPPEDLNRLFQPFEQLSEAGTQKGAGLGLVIARQFVELMGGTIGVTSEVGRGSLFRVEVPVELVGAAAAAAQERAAETREVVGMASGTPRYRILIADDQLDNQILMKQLMQKIGLDAKVAANGRECVKLFQEWHPHLIWMDRGMPAMSGIEAAQCIRRLPGGRDVKIVAVTAAVFKEQQLEMLNAGMDDLVRKPYRFEEIYAALARQLRVEYVYEEAAVGADPVPAALTPEMLAILPAPLREELKAVLEALDSGRIEAVLQEVSSIDEMLGRTLMRLAEDFDYPSILKALSAAAAAAPADLSSV
jgi:CheY-like chemotaxis protein